MTRDNIIPLHRGIVTPAESAFDRDLRADRDRLAAEYEHRCAELDYPVAVRFTPVPVEPRAIFTADELVFACFVSFVVGVLFLAGSAWLWTVL